MKISILVWFGKILTAFERGPTLSVYIIRVIWILNPSRHTRIPIADIRANRHGRRGCTIRKLIQRLLPRLVPFSSGYLPFFTHCFHFFSRWPFVRLFLCLSHSLTSVLRIGPSVIPLLSFRATAVGVSEFLQKSTQKWC